MGKGGKDKKKSDSASASTPPPGVSVSDPDVYGQVHPHETPELVQEKLKEFEDELAKIDDATRKSADEAKSKCVDGILTADFKLMFLRCEIFNADLAAKRFCSYWDMRIEIFGPEKAFLPLTLKEACRDDRVAMEMGFARLVPNVRDPQGRRIILADPSRQDKTKYTRHSMTRNLWYILHAALEDEQSQKHGIVFVAHPHHAKASQTDRAQMKLDMNCLQGRIPVRVAAFHICRPPSFFTYIIFPIVKLFLSARLLKRFRVYGGSYESICKKLEDDVGLTKDMLPTDVGGNVEVKHEEWLAAREAAGK